MGTYLGTRGGSELGTDLRSGLEVEVRLGTEQGLG
jgi:hypothetical protein